MTSISSPHPVYGLDDNLGAGKLRREENTLPHDHGSTGSNDHLASIYDDQDEQFATVVPFIRQGLAQGERCLYIADDNSKEDVLTALREGGIDVAEAVESGALSIHTKADTYLRTGDFDREAMLEFWEESLTQAREQEGFEGIRAAAEMTWALDSDTEVDYVVGYEALLNTIYPGEAYTALCQYNRNRFPPDVIADVIRSHPHVIHNNTVCPNSAYQPPNEFFESDGPPLAGDLTETKSPPTPHASPISTDTRDNTARMEHERARKRYETIVETTDDFVYTLDADGHFTFLNEASVSLSGVSREELLGEHASTVFTEETVAAVEERIAALLRDEERSSLTEELPLRTVDGTETWYEVNITPLLADDGTFQGTAGVARDITERKRHETRLSTLNELTQACLDADTRQQVANLVVDRAAERLDLPVALVALYDESSNMLTPVAATQPAEATLDVTELLATESLAWQTFVENEPRRLTNDADELGTACGPVGIWPLGRHGVVVTSVAPDAAVADAFGATVAATIQSAFDSTERLQRLEERETRLTDLTAHLERLHRVNEVIRRVDRALVSASSRSAIEEAVCEELARFEPYRFVVMSDYDRLDERVVARAWAGDEQGYLDAVNLAAGPTGDAAEMRDPQVVQELLADPPLEPWREAALTREFGACLALPLLYGDSLYGVLTVFGDRPQLFDEMERDVLAELADNVAQTINAVESKKALVSDRVVELEFTTRSEEVPFVALATETGGTFEFESVVPQADGRFRGFFTVRQADADDVRAFLRQTVAVEECQLVADRDDGLLFSCLLTDAAVISHLVDHGVVPRELAAEPGEGRLVVELSPDVDVREFVETLEAGCPDVELVAKRTHERSLRTRQGFRTAIEDSLTDRQLEILQTAYNCGYFESPRASTGEAVAAALDISQPTFATHLRTTHRKILNLLFEDPPD